jgi:hypothetical protein
MGSFDAGASVGKLDWTFEPYAKDKGVLKEPSDEAIGAFIDGLKGVYKSVRESGLAELEKLGDNPTPDEMMGAINMVGGDEFVKLNRQVAELHGALCSGKPGADQIMILPLRVRTQFYTWLRDEVVNPEAESGDGAQVVTLPPRAATGS